MVALLSAAGERGGCTSCVQRLTASRETDGRVARGQDLVDPLVKGSSTC